LVRGGDHHGLAASRDDNVEADAWRDDEREVEGVELHLVGVLALRLAGEADDDGRVGHLRVDHRHRRGVGAGGDRDVDQALALERRALRGRRERCHGGTPAVGVEVRG
jgi:hypothetical protein